MTSDARDPDDFDGDTEQAHEQLLVWGLCEELGRDRPIDLVAGVHARLRRESEARPRLATQRSWLAAAGIFLGTAVVLAIALWQPDQETSTTQQPEPTPRQVQAPQPIQIVSLAEAEALPIETRAVEAIGADDAVIAALTRLRDLEVLIVREPWNESYGMGLKMMAPSRPAHITNACWQHFARFTKLRALRLSGTSLVARIQTGNGDDVVTALERLPLLEELWLRALDCDDQVLQRLSKLRNLRRLNLDFNHGFSDPGIQGLLQCEQLVSLSLQGCQQLYGSSLAALADLPNLERLDLRSIDQMSWRAGTGEPDDAEGQQLRNRARRIADSLGVGVNDATLRGLAQAPRLRVLEMSNGRWTANGLAELGASTSLRELNMFGGQETSESFVQHLPTALTRLEVCADFTDAFCRAVRQHLPALQHLNLAACDQITDDGLREVLGIASLRVLDMRQMRGLTVVSIDALAAATQLEELDLRHNEFVTAAHVTRLQRALPNLRKLDSNP